MANEDKRPVWSANKTVWSVSFTVVINGKRLTGEFDYLFRSEAKAAIRALIRNSKRSRTFNLEGVLTIKN